MTDEEIKSKLTKILPYLNERQKRILLAAEALSIGYGGVSRVSRITGITRPTVHAGLKDLDKQDEGEIANIRSEGGGRKSTHTGDKRITGLVESLVDGSTRGDPMSPLKWTSKSTRNIADELCNKGVKISHVSVKTILKNLDYSLQGNGKSLEDSHPDRDEQFRFIARKVKKFLKEGLPVISVDTKKKELIGNYANKGKEWRKKGDKKKVKGRDFPEKDKKVGMPYGIYDQGKNIGWVNVGCDHDTADFAVQSIHRWWTYMGRKLYPTAGDILICADSGGSNGYRVRLWKSKLQEFVNKHGVEVSVVHFPSGTSKWNKIEHRLFSHISMNWKAQPLVSYDVMINLIGGTGTKTGLKAKAKLDKRKYPIGIIISDEEMEKVNIKTEQFHGDWNYKILKSLE